MQSIRKYIKQVFLCGLLFVLSMAVLPFTVVSCSGRVDDSSLDSLRWIDSMRTMDSLSHVDSVRRADSARRADSLRWLLIDTARIANWSFYVNGLKVQMVGVQGGEFTMGRAGETLNPVQYDTEVLEDEVPSHRVVVSSFQMARTEVTQQLWLQLMGRDEVAQRWNDEVGLGDSYPAYGMSYEDVRTFLFKLNELLFLSGAMDTSEMEITLPTEAEWEYAAKGGRRSAGYRYAGSDTLVHVGWFYDNSYAKGKGQRGYGTHRVASRRYNELGLYDMSGNVKEWCRDFFGPYSPDRQADPSGPWTGNRHVVRGGAWDEYSGYCRVTYREAVYANGGNESTGFRLVARNKRRNIKK